MSGERKEVVGMTSEPQTGAVPYSSNLSEVRMRASRPFLPPEDASPTIKDYMSILKRSLTLALLVFAGIFILVACYTFMVRSTYRSVAALLIEDNVSMDTDLGKKISSITHFRQQVATEAETLRSRSLAEQLVAKMNLAESDDFTSRRRLWLRWIRKHLLSWVWAGSANEAESEGMKRQGQVVEMLQRRLSVRQREQSRFLEICMDASSPELAQSMLKTYLGLYSDAKSERERKSNLDMLRWLRMELVKAQKSVLDSEAALVKFIADHGIVPSEDGGLTEMVEMIKKKKEGVMKAQELEAKLQGLKRSDGSARFTMGSDVPEDEILKKLKEHLATLENEYTKITAAYSSDSLKAQLAERRMRDVERRIAAIQNKSVTQALQAAQKEADILSASVGHAKEEALRIGELGAQYAILKKDVDTNKELHRILLKDYKETLIRSRTDHSPITVIDQPSLPMEPIWPKKGLLLSLGTLLAITGSLLAVFTRQFLETTRETTRQLEEEFNMANLGMVPDASRLKRLHPAGDSRYEFLSYKRPISPLADSMRNIHASILFATLESESIRSAVVSSATKGEGKTFISVSLATALTCNNSMLTSCSSKRILVVDCDMRRPNIHKVFQPMINTTGLTTLLTSNDAAVESVIRGYDEIPGLFYITAGPTVPDPAALLMSDRFGVVVNELKSRFDFIIFDSPPILGFPDIRILSRYSDGVILVVEEGRLRQLELRAAISAVASAPGSRILGLVLNKAKPNKTQYRYGGYYYYSGTGRNGGNG